MGEHEGWMGQPSGVLLNGLLSNESTPVVCALNADRWMRAEERTAELMACIQPNPPSEERRKAVADYVQRLILKCFPCQVVTFGSVPLKTYLPDGDIDLTAFSNNLNLNDTWAALVRDILEREEKNENAEFRVKEIQFIEAEVKLIKCLVENIVVDISFNQVGGLCTLCFLEEVDHLINQNHLFKRSIILIKAWCYYESRILGAHHGLISTYALETLVLYIFHVFNNSFAGPLEVLYRFLEFFSNFDWDNFCLSLWGPVPISALPDVTPKPPRKDSEKLLLTGGFLEKCNAAYAVFPTGQENPGQPFNPKHFNVIDPLRVNNNLGRSVSKGNFFRIRSAFAFGAKRLARLLYCPKEDIDFELNQFFMNTWERHGSRNRPDAPTHDLQHLDLSQGLNNHMSVSCGKKVKERSFAHESVVEGINNAYTHAIQQSNHPSESTSAKNDVSSFPNAQTQEFAYQNSSRMFDRPEKGGSNQRRLKLNNNVNEYIQGKFPFARTKSSPAIAETCTNTSSRPRHNKAQTNVENHVSSAKTDDSRTKNVRPDTVLTQSTISSSDDPSFRHLSPHQNENSIDSNSSSYSHIEDSRHGNMREEHASAVGAQGMLQEEQDIVNIMSSSMNNMGVQVPVPLNFSTHMPLPYSPSMLASFGYAQRNLAGLMPGNIPLVDPSWASNMHFAQGVIPTSLPQYFPGIGLTSTSGGVVDQVNENHDSAERTPGDAVNDFLLERDGSSNERFVVDDGNLERLNSGDTQPSTSRNSGFVQSSRLSGSSRHQQKHTKDNRGSIRDERHDNSQRPNRRISDVYPDDWAGNARLSSASQVSSLRSSDGSWDGSSSTKASKNTRDRKGRKPTTSATPSAIYGKGKRASEHASVEVEDVVGDGGAATLGNEMAERNSASQPGSGAALYFPRHSGSDSFMPMGQVLLDPGSDQRGADGSGALPVAFYPTGPPVPFFTMIPFRSDARSYDSLVTELGRDEGLNDATSSPNFESSDGLYDSETFNASSSLGRAYTTLPPEEPKDILNGDFLSHWQNLQFGRSCQDPRIVFPSPVLVPPGYMQGRSPWDGPGIPNMFSQMMSYNPHLVPISPVQPVSDPPAHPRYVGDMPRYRAGTGTYLPNPRASRDRHSSWTRRNSYNYDGNDNREERDGNWNISKSRAANRNHNRNQADKSSSRLDRLPSNERWAERPWSSHSHESLPPSLHPTSSQSTANVAYGIYPLQGMNPNRAASDGPPVPPVVMFYPYGNSSGFGGSPSEPLEFGSVGAMGFVGSNAAPHAMEGVRAWGLVEEQRFYASSQRSSPDQPSSPRLQRRT